MRKYRVVYMILGERHQLAEDFTSYNAALNAAAELRERKFWAFVERIRP